MTDLRWNIVFIGALLFMAVVAALLIEGDAAVYFAVPPKS